MSLRPIVPAPLNVPAQVQDPAPSATPGVAPAVRGTDAFDSHPSAPLAGVRSLPMPQVPPSLLWRVPPQRSPAQALEFIQNLDARLGLAPAAQQARSANMAEDAHTFFRANPGLFHADLVGAFADCTPLLPRPAPQLTILGDVHLKNFGTLRGPEGEAVFGPNDFDQAGRGSPEADLQRLAVSVALTGREAGLDDQELEELIAALGQGYATEVERLAEAGAPARPYLTAEEATGKIADRIEDVQERTPADLFEDLLDGSGRFLRNEELLEPSLADARRIAQALAAHEQALGPTPKVERPLRVLDVAEKLGSGGSSLGLPRHYVLVAGEGKGAAPVVLELKELLPLAMADEGGARGDAIGAAARQVELGAKLNPLSGAVAAEGRTLLIRELEPEKGGLKGKDLDSKKELRSAVEQTARILARQHGRLPEQAAALDTWLGGEGDVLGAALAGFGAAYAHQVEADFEAFTQA